MASSFSSQIPGILHVIQRVAPKTVLDIGKGFGKYGFLIHEYCGIPNLRRVDPSLTMREQSDIRIDAVEVDENLLLPHLSQIYDKVHVGDVLTIYKGLPRYDLVLMIDIIEHIDKEAATGMLKAFLSQGSVILVATPRIFFPQHLDGQDLYDSVYERHVSHWTTGDFKSLGFVEHQHYDSGAVYLLSASKIDIRGFGNGFMKRLRRLARAFRSEL